MGYDFKNYANGIIYTLGFKHANIKFKNCKGLDAKNTEKFKKKIKINAKSKKKIITIKVVDKIYKTPMKGLKILIKINGKTYKKITSKKGIIKFSAKKLPAKKYKATIKYLGNNFNQKASATVTVK